MNETLYRSLDVDIELKTVLDDISIVIPTVGRSILETSLFHIVEGSAWPWGLIVVDQGQNAQIAGWIDRLQCLGIQAEYVPSNQRGRAAAVNRGLERVKTRFVAVTDDDCFVDSNWLENMVLYLKAYPGSIVTGRVEPGGENVIVVVAWPEPRTYRKPGLRFDTLSGGNMGVSLEVVNRVGMLDEHETVRTAEDGEWAYRALRAGVPIVYRPEISVTHHDWRDESKRHIQYRDYAYSQGGFYGKYLRQGDWLIALRVGINYVRAAKRYFVGIVTGNQELRRHGLAYLAGHPPGIVAGMRRGKGA